jgi:uncharacterized protein (TIGR00730 family)
MIRIRRQFVLLLRVVWDFLQGMYAFHLVGHCITVFGSARLTRQSAIYAEAYKVGVALGENHYTVMTGGGPGLMEAASRGARESGAKCIACRIRLPFEQSRNNYIDRSVSFRYFFVRKVMLMRHSCALIVLPGGLGTLDEVFEVLTLIQTQKIPPIPIVFIGREYWQQLFDVVKGMVAAGTISIAEMDRLSRLMLVTDDVSEMIAHLKVHTGCLGDNGFSAPRQTVSSDRHTATVKATQ